MRRFKTQMLHQRKLIVLAMAALLAEVLFRLLEPWPLKFIIDDVLGLAVVGRVQPAADPANPMLLLLLAVIAVVVFASARAGCAYLATVGFALAGNRVLVEVRNQLYAHLQALSLRFHQQARGGDLVTRITGDMGLLRDVLVTAFLPLTGNLVVLSAMLAVMAWLNWRLTGIVLAMAPLVVISTRYKRKRIRTVAREQRSREGALAATAAESMAAIGTVQAFSLGDRFNAQFAATANQDLKQGVKGKRLAAGLERTVDVVLAATTALVLWVGSMDVLLGRSTPGELLVFLAYLKGAFKPARNWAKYTARISKAGAAAERVMEVLDSPLDVAALSDAPMLGQVRGKVEFRDVVFSHAPDVATLRRLSFSVGAGEYLVIVGPSGAGKSTVLSLLLRLYDPDHGQVLIDGTDVRKCVPQSVREQIAVVLQDTILFNGTLAENISHGAVDPPSQAQIERAARVASMHAFISALPHGYETRVSERGVTLSSGQRQRIGIARAAVRDAPILLLDEPLASVDKANAHHLYQSLRSLREGRTTLHVTHDLDQVMEADRVLYVGSRESFASGTHEQLLRISPGYRRLNEYHRHAQAAS